MEEVSPLKVQQVVLEGFERLKRYRAARAMFTKQYVGQYYCAEKGKTGDEPINLMFNAVRAIVPSIVMRTPTNAVTTQYVANKEYAELLSLGLNSIEEKINLKAKLRAWVVSALFSMGIMKVGLSSSGQFINFGEDSIDPGQLYADIVDLDNFVMDPSCTAKEKSGFLGDRILVPRQSLLDIDGYDHDLIRQLPSAFQATGSGKDVKDITQSNKNRQTMYSLQDYVHVVELWVPGANALVTIPDPREITFEKYLRVTDYFGPNSGPYSFLALTQPVDDNPLPVAPVSIWYDMHRAANRMFKKVMEQADRQKDLVLYEPSQADEADAIRDAMDGDTIACTNPNGINSISIGGQNKDNSAMLQQLQIWFNYMSGNPDQLSGQKSNANTATQANILQSNASVSLEDTRDMTYEGTADISSKLAWYMHTDPLIDLPLTKRKTGGEVIQLQLTPEQRSGDFLEFVFKIVPKSMSKLDPQLRAKHIMDFGTNILPAAVNAAMLMMQIGQPFNLAAFLTLISEEMGIGDWVQDLFYDPEFQQKMQMYLAMGAQNAGKATEGGGSQMSTKGILQNHGFPGQTNIPGADTINNQSAQMGANDSQSANQGVY